MLLHRIAIEQPEVGGEILAEIRHPAIEPEIEHPFADHLLGEPVAGGRIGEVHHARLELAEIDEVGRIRIQPPREIALGRRLREQRAVHREVGVHIAEEADAPRLQRGDALRKIGIAGRVPLPVPEQPPPEAGLADADPVLAPQARNRRTSRDQASSRSKEASPCLRPTTAPPSAQSGSA